MDDTEHANDFPPLTIEQIQGLVDSARLSVERCRASVGFS